MQSTKEIWKVIPGFENYYVSNLGRIKNTRGKLLKPGTVYQYGQIRRQQVILWPAQKVKTIHSLVMLVFGTPKINKRDTIDHIDRNPLNNIISNLRWASPQTQCANKNKSLGKRKISTNELNIIYQRTKTETLQQISEDIKIDRTHIHVLLKYIHPDY